MRYFILASLLLLTSPALAQFSIDSPLPNSVQSGTVAPPTGWRCNAGEITASIDNGPTINFTERQNRGDTAGPCSNTGNNAFIIAQPWNWNVFGDGQQEIVFFDDGVPFASIRFEIATFGTEFLIGPAVSFTVPNFPDPGGDVVVTWDNAIQNFRITQVIENGPPSTGLQGLLGQWQFNYTIGGTAFNQIYNLQSIRTSTTNMNIQIITGEGEAGNPVGAGRVQDIDPGSSLPFEFFLLDLGITLCRFFVFDQTSATAVRGEYFALTSTNAGVCSSLLGGSHPMNGTRLSSPSSGKGSAFLRESGQLAEMQEVQREKTEGVDRGTAAALDRLVKQMQVQQPR